MNSKVSFRDYVPDIFAFILGISIAWFLEWETADLVWSLWLSSLVVGYLTIISTIASGAIIGWSLSKDQHLPAQKRRAAQLGDSVQALIHLIFFSLHFCGFHAAHAGFLSDIFPLEGVSPEVFFDNFLNPVGLWQAAIVNVLPLYGVFVISVIIAERHHLLGPLVRAYQAYRRTSTGKQTGEKNLSQPAREAGGKTIAKASFKRPYLYVMKTHCLIVFFGTASAIDLTSDWLFVAAYFVYFFPWHAFKIKLAPKDSGPLAGTRESAK